MTPAYFAFGLSSGACAELSSEGAARVDTQKARNAQAVNQTIHGYQKLGKIIGLHYIFRNFREGHRHKKSFMAYRTQLLYANFKNKTLRREQFVAMGSIRLKLFSEVKQVSKKPNSDWLNLGGPRDPQKNDFVKSDLQGLQSSLTGELRCVDYRYGVCMIQDPLEDPQNRSKSRNVRLICADYRYGIGTM